jgi:hypothetical protein
MRTDAQGTISIIKILRVGGRRGRAGVAGIRWQNREL